MRKIFLSAGEASGDLHGAHLVRALRAREPDCRITCLGGPRLREAGAQVLVDNREIAVVGLFEVFRHLKEILGAWKRIRSHLEAERPDVLVLIDFPDFNLLLAQRARRLGIKVFYYISPQVWAWRQGRVRTIKRLVDSMVVILPFEADFYARHGIRVDYVGHPLLDALAHAPSRAAARERYGAAGPVVGLLPGSRLGEIRTLLPILLDTAAILSRAVPGISFLLPVAPSLDAGGIQEYLDRRDPLPIELVAGDTHGVIRACDLVITASGTVTLETAILETPMLIIYRVSDFTYYAGRHLIRVPCVGLPNLIAGRIVAPEFLQQKARADRIAAQALDWLRHPQSLDAQRLALSTIRRCLGTPGVADRVARLVLAQ